MLNHLQAIREYWKRGFLPSEILDAMKDAGYFRRKVRPMALRFIQQRVREFGESGLSASRHVGTQCENPCGTVEGHGGTPQMQANGRSNMAAEARSGYQAPPARKKSVERVEALLRLSATPKKVNGAW